MIRLVPYPIHHLIDTSLINTFIESKNCFANDKKQRHVCQNMWHFVLNTCAVAITDRRILLAFTSLVAVFYSGPQNSLFVFLLEIRQGI